MPPARNASYPSSRAQLRDALAVAAAGGAVALIEDPDSVRNFWNDIPSYVQSGQKMLGRLEGLIEQVAEQGSQFKDALRRL